MRMSCRHKWCANSKSKAHSSSNNLIQGISLGSVVLGLRILSLKKVAKKKGIFSERREAQTGLIIEGRAL